MQGTGKKEVKEVKYLYKSRQYMKSSYNSKVLLCPCLLIEDVITQTYFLLQLPFRT